MHAVILIAVAVFLAGCGLTPWGDAARETIKTRGAAIADQGLNNSIWFSCDAATMGSVRRKFGQTQETADAYRLFCNLNQGDADLISPLDPE